MIEINNLTKFSVDKKLFLGVAKKVLKGENKGMENLSIAFVNPGEMQKLNRKYRRKDKSTDVLSFGKVAHFKDDVNEVVICPETVKKEAKIYKKAFKKELIKVLIHGVLHTLGYDHEVSKSQEEKMYQKQEYYLSRV